jgi:hypothetical protein
MLEGAAMTGEDVRQVFEAILPQQEIERLCAPFGGIERQRKLHLGMLVRAMIISAGSPGRAHQADILRSYRECEVPKVARSACYRWLDEPLEHFMAALAERARPYARAQQVDLSGILGGVKNWYMVDSTPVTVREALRAEFPGTGKYAALIVHQGLSIGCGAPVRDHFSPAREHDSRHLESDASWRGCGLLVDLAYASLARLRACHTHGGALSSGSKTTGSPRSTRLPAARSPQSSSPAPTSMSSWRKRSSCSTAEPSMPMCTMKRCAMWKKYMSDWISMNNYSSFWTRMML